MVALPLFQRPPHDDVRGGLLGQATRHERLRLRAVNAADCPVTSELCGGIVQIGAVSARGPIGMSKLRV